MSVKTVNPATEEVLREYKYQSDDELERALADGAEAFAHWRLVPMSTRLECVRVFAESLQGGRMAVAEMMSAEMGKTLEGATAEVDKSVKSCLYLRENYPKWKEQLEYRLPNGFSVSREPMGLLFGIMPWNFPLWQVVRFAVPALLSGNAIVLKHAAMTFGSAELICDLFRQAFPDGLYQNLLIDHDQSAKIIADRRVRGVSLTGSRRAGMTVGELAGRNLKKCVLELGGSDAYVILDDADLDHAAKTCAAGRLVNAGQSCVAAKRFIVTKKNAEAFTAKLAAEMKAAKNVAPMARKDLRAELQKQVDESVRQGARKILGGEIPSGRGYFYPPSVLAGVKPGMPAFDDELFGPVAAVIEAVDEKQAIALANRSIYGLGGGIFSRDVKRAQELARTEFESGMVCINDFVKSDASAPFGGVKDSGLGRELGREGCFEFTVVKSVFTPPAK
jgi:succinate-semialdehyde dehydrogenase/glutarate-semialdehyde dehydrogenase